MSTTTSRVGFYLPADDGSEPVNVATDLNDNLEKLDSTIGFVPSTSASPPASPYNGMATYETDTNVAKFYKASTWSQLLSAGATFASNLLMSAANRIGIGVASPAAIVDVAVTNSTTVPLIKYKTTSETTHRIEIDYDGFRIGGGSTAPEVRLYRPTSGQLVIDAVGTAVTGGLTVAGNSALSSLDISGNASLGGTLNSNLSVAGDISATGKGIVNTIVKTTNATRTSTVTPTPDTDFVIPLAANTTYFIEVYMLNSGVGDLQVSWTGPSGVSGFRWCLGMAAAGTDATATSMRTGAHQFATGVIYGTISDTTYTGAQEVLTVTTGVTAGNLVLNFAQGTSSTTATTLRAGSLVQYRKVA